MVGGSREHDEPNPVGEYAMSCLGRERMYEHFSRTQGTPMALVRLNYAHELRYGVIVDMAQQIWAEQPIDVTMGNFNGGTGRFINQGTFTKASSTRTLIGEGTAMDFENTGTLNVDAGYLRLSSSRVSSTCLKTSAKLPAWKRWR